MSAPQPRRPAPSVRGDGTVDQAWSDYTADEHAIWRHLFERQGSVLAGRACAEFLAGLDGLGIAADGIPDFDRLSDVLAARTGWRIVAVPGLVPDAIFFEHLAQRRFPATCFIRSRAELDYLPEPDVFHDIYGHVPLLLNPVFADYMQAYGRGGLKASGQAALDYLARLYWYTVEFGLIATPGGLRLYGSGILSSKAEAIFSLEDASPNHLGFDLLRVMRTRYRIDDFQEIYFVIDGFEQLFDATRPDFTPYYAALHQLPAHEPGTILPGDRVLRRGSGAWHAGRHR